MEYRKLISFGKSSFVVSLPKSWVTQNKLKKGDFIYFDESESELILQPRGEKLDEEKEKVIFVDGKTIARIGREVSAAYIMNYRQIVLKGAEIKNKIKDLQLVIQNLIALEIMEQTSDTIVAKDFLNMDKVNLVELLRKMDVVTRTMFQESCKIFVEDNYNNINERDKDVNRLYFLLYRASLYNMLNPMKAIKNLKMNMVELLRIQNLGFYMEAIADEVRRTVRYVRLLKITPTKQKEIETLLKKLNEYYLETMKATHTKNIELALQLSEMKTTFDKELDLLEKDVQKVDNLNQVVNRIRRLVTVIHNLARVVYTLV